MIYQKLIKPIIDTSIAAILLLILSPIMILISIVLMFVNRGSPFFMQTRPGEHGKPFSIIKFKTMNDKLDEEGKLLPDSMRLTKIGQLLRKTSLDEIPQLINVLKGDLSLVGPRPLLMQYLPHYSEEQLQRHNVKPGITGWAQVNGRTSISFDKRFELDVWYARNLSFKLDIKILIMTFLNVIRSKGVIEEDGFWKE